MMMMMTPMTTTTAIATPLHLNNGQCRCLAASCACGAFWTLPAGSWWRRRPATGPLPGRSSSMPRRTRGSVYSRSSCTHDGLVVHTTAGQRGISTKRDFVDGSMAVFTEVIHARKRPAWCPLECDWFGHSNVRHRRTLTSVVCVRWQSDTVKSNPHIPYIVLGTSKHPTLKPHCNHNKLCEPYCRKLRLRRTRPAHCTPDQRG
jgi:hypothetical protein